MVTQTQSTAKDRPYATASRSSTASSTAGRIKDSRILDHDLIVDADELTPSMKLKREVLESPYSSLMDPIYTG